MFVDLVAQRSLREGMETGASAAELRFVPTGPRFAMVSGATQFACLVHPAVFSAIPLERHGEGPLKRPNSWPRINRAFDIFDDADARVEPDVDSRHVVVTVGLKASAEDRERRGSREDARPMTR